MGYDLHITRRVDWADDEGPPITEDEWLRLVESDPELRLDPDNGPNFALWSGHSENPEPWLACDERGEIFTKHPDEALIRKMIRIAEGLGAKVQGDDNEVYDDEFPAGRTLRDARPRMTWPGLLLRAGLAYVIFALLGGAIAAVAPLFAS